MPSFKERRRSRVNISVKLHVLRCVYGANNKLVIRCIKQFINLFRKMDINIDVRKKQLQSLDQYITSSKDKVQSILDYLGWNTKKTVDKESEIICSVNPGHTIALKNAEVHLKKCFVKTSGYQSGDEFLSEPINDPFTSIKLDQAKKIDILSKARENNQKFKADIYFISTDMSLLKIISPSWNGQDPDPMTSDRLFTTFSNDERLVLYDYCVQNTEHPPIPSEFNIQIQDKKEEKFLTQEELLAKQRDAKRRRVKYKSVHTSRNKSYTEVIKEVINNQMEQYKDYLESQMEVKTEVSTDQIDEQNSYLSNTNADILIKENTNDMERPSSSVSRHSNHSGSSRSRKDYKYEKLYKNHNHDLDYRREYKEYDKRHGYDSKYDHNSHKENRRYKGFEDDYRHSRDKKEWYKSERRH